MPRFPYGRRDQARAREQRCRQGRTRSYQIVAAAKTVLLPTLRRRHCTLMFGRIDPLLRQVTQGNKLKDRLAKKRKERENQLVREKADAESVKVFLVFQSSLPVLAACPRYRRCRFVLTSLLLRLLVLVQVLVSIFLLWFSLLQ